MVRYVQTMCMIIIVALLLCGCIVPATYNNEDNTPTTPKTNEILTPTDPAKPTEPAEPTAPTESTAPTEPQKTITKPVTKEDFQTFFRENYWYLRALSCTFEKPEDIAMEFYFYSSLAIGDRQSESSFTTEEKTWAKTKWDNGYGDVHKMPVAKINEALSILGVTIKDVKIPECWVYYDKTDAYYDWRSDAFGVVGWKITEVAKNADGTVQVYWETDQMHMDTSTGVIHKDGVKMVMTLKENGDTYLVLSNIPAA